MWPCCGCARCLLWAKNCRSESSPQADGTNLWYVGNNTQYPVLQDVLDAVSDGDEVVVRRLVCGILTIDNVEITLRPYVTSNGDVANYEQVTFLNPTEGFNNDNGWA